MQLPSIEVIGLYSPKDNAARYHEFIEAKIEARDPKNFDAETIALFRRLGRGDALTPLSDDDKAEISAHLDRELSSAVLVEALVTGADDRFNAGDFQQPNPSLDSGLWQVAWDERYLSADGTALLASTDPFSRPSDSNLRLVFYIHRWQTDQPLLSSYGPVPLPPIQPMPDRLWNLAPYREVD